MRTAFIVGPAILLVLVGCGAGPQVTVYSIRRVDPETHHGHSWITNNPTTYKVGADSVVAETMGILRKYEDCTILNSRDWSCNHSDGSGSFGIRAGSFWQHPAWDDTEYVSKVEYNITRCQWAISDPYDGPFWGSLRCATYWL